MCILVESFEQTLTFLYVIGLILIVITTHLVKNILAVWSYCLLFYRDCSSFFQWAKFGLFLLSSFSYVKYSTNMTINDKSIAGVLGTETQCGRMVSADESTDLWWLLISNVTILDNF